MASQRFSVNDFETPDGYVLRPCPHCHRDAHQILTTPRILVDGGDQFYPYRLEDRAGAFVPRGASVSVEAWRAQLEVSEEWESYEPGAPWQATLCAFCQRMSLWRSGELVFPTRISDAPPPHPDMPDDAKRLYEEASAVLPGSRRAAAALARAALEALLKATDEDPTRRDLNTRLGSLQKRIKPALWKVLTALKVVGNGALHGEDDEIVTLYLSDEDGELANVFFDAINALVEELITAQDEADELYAKIPANKREGAERAAK